MKDRLLGLAKRALDNPVRGFFETPKLYHVSEGLPVTVFSRSAEGIDLRVVVSDDTGIVEYWPEDDAIVFQKISDGGRKMIGAFNAGDVMLGLPLGKNAVLNNSSK